MGVNLVRLANRNSYVVVAGLVLMIGAFFASVGRSIFGWIAWLACGGVLVAGFFLLRPGGAKTTEGELEGAIGAGRPVLLELYSNY